MKDTIGKGFAMQAKSVQNVAEIPGRKMQLLVIDDSEIDRQRLIRTCRSAGLEFEPTEAATLAEMRAALERTDFDLVFIDYLLAGEDGLQAVDLLQAFPRQRAAAIMIAGEGRLDIAVEAMRRGCSDYITKSEMSVEALQKSIATSLERRLLASSLQEEQARRHDLERAIRTYANACSAEMRSIIAATLRRVRKLRQHAVDGAFAADIADVETQIERLFGALPSFRNACETATGGLAMLPEPQGA